MSFIRLQREEGFHYLAAHTFMRSSPSFDHVIEAECAIQSVTDRGATTAPLRVPLSDFATFPIGSTFGRSRAHVTRIAKRRRSRRDILLGNMFEAWRTDRQVEVHQKNPQRRWRLPLVSSETVLLDTIDPAARLGMTHGEQFRFLCSGVSLLLDTLSMISLAPNASIASMFVDAGESGIDEHGTLVITPHRAFQNLTATMQIALLLSEPTIAEYLRTSFLSVKRDLLAGRDAIPGRMPFGEAASYTIESERIGVLREDGSVESVEFCDRIVADHRRPNFKDIVVRVRRSKADPIIEMIEELKTAEEKERERVTSSTKVVRYPQSSGKTIRLAQMLSEFSRLYPSFAPTKVRFDRETTVSDFHASARKVIWIESELPLATTAQGGGGPAPVPKVETGPTVSRPFERPTVGEHFLAATDVPGLTPVTVAWEQMPSLMRSFLEARIYLDDVMAVHLLPSVDLRRGEDLLFEVPASWAGLASIDRDGRPRLIATAPLVVNQGLVWAIEILRRNEREEFAIGLCSPRVHDDGLSFVGRLLRSICERTNRRRGEEVPGTFPRAEYLDVRIDSVIHRGGALWDGQSLSQVLRSRAHLLLAPDRSF